MANPYFNATYYLANNPDVFAAGINTAEGAWAHYEQYGAAEALNGVASRSPAPWFDIAYYLAENPDLNTAGLTAGQLFTHFTEYGLAEGRSPSLAAEAVDATSLAAYAAANADLREAFGIEDGEEPNADQLILLAKHFYEFGYKENREGLPAEFSDDAPGAVFTMTTGVDTWTGTNGDDVVQAIVSGGADETINTFDNIDGGAGRDTLNIAGAGGSGIPANSTFKNIEVVNIATTAAVTGLNSASFEDVEELWQVGVAAGLTVGEGVTAGFRNVLLAGAGAETVTAADGVDSVAVALDNVVNNSVVEIGETTAGDVTSATVSGSVAGAGALTVDTATSTTSVDTINLAITSSGVITLTPVVAVLEVVDASGSTGNLTIDASLVTALEVFVGGAGNDTLTADNAVLTAEAISIDAGAGVDTINYAIDLGAAAIASSLTGGAGGDTFTLRSVATGNLFAAADEEDLLESLVTITDFSAAEDVVDISGINAIGGRVAQNTVNNAITAADPDDLFDVVTAVAAVTAANDFATFAYEGSTYIFVNQGASTALDTGDTLIELAGIAVADLTAANFVF